MQDKKMALLLRTAALIFAVLIAAVIYRTGDTATIRAIATVLVFTSPLAFLLNVRLS
jgi:hypothetical protein